MAKPKYFDTKNVVVSIEALGVSVVTSLVVGLLVFATRYFHKTLEMPVVALASGLVTLGLYLLTWGFFARKFWGWK